MADRAAKEALFTEVAAVGKALSNPKRLELLDLLGQGPRSVEELAAAAGLGITTCSAHLQLLRTAGMVTTRRDGTRIYYSLAGDDVAALLTGLRAAAHRHRPQARAARRAYLGPDDTEAVPREELLRRSITGDVVVLDVRPAVEYAAGHLPGAVHIPLGELPDRLAELPRDREVLVYCRGADCVLAHDAVRLLARRGRAAKRAAEGVLEWRSAGIVLEVGAA